MIGRAGWNISVQDETFLTPRPEKMLDIAAGLPRNWTIPDRACLWLLGLIQDLLCWPFRRIHGWPLVDDSKQKVEMMRSSPSNIRFTFMVVICTSQHHGFIQYTTTTCFSLFEFVLSSPHVERDSVLKSIIFLIVRAEIATARGSSAPHS